MRERALHRGLLALPPGVKGRVPWHWHSLCSLCRTSGCLSTSTTPVTTPHTCHLDPSSSPRGGGPPCCPSFSPGMKGEGRLTPPALLAQRHGTVSQLGKRRRMEKQELAGLVLSEAVPGYVFALVLGPGWVSRESLCDPQISCCMSSVDVWPMQEGVTIKTLGRGARSLVGRDVSTAGYTEGAGAPFLPSFCPSTLLRVLFCPSAGIQGPLMSVRCWASFA